MSKRSFYSYTMLFLISFFIVLPVFIMVKIAFSDPQALINQQQFQFTWQHIRDIFLSGNVIMPLQRSLVVASITAVIAVTIATPGAYVLAKLPGRWGHTLIMLIFFTRMIPEVGVALPVSVNFMKMGLFDSILGLALAHLIRVLPLIAWILLNTFKTLPRAVEEAAFMDGCNKLTLLTKIIFPMARPGIVVAFIFAFLNSWDEFIYASYLSISQKTLPLMVYYYADRGGLFTSQAYALVITIPVVVFTYIFQKYMKSNYLAGAVKH